MIFKLSWEWALSDVFFGVSCFLVHTICNFFDILYLWHNLIVIDLDLDCSPARFSASPSLAITFNKVRFTVAFWQSLQSGWFISVTDFLKCKLKTVKSLYSFWLVLSNLSRFLLSDLSISANVLFLSIALPLKGESSYAEPWKWFC